VPLPDLPLATLPREVPVGAALQKHRPGGTRPKLGPKPAAIARSTIGTPCEPPAGAKEKQSGDSACGSHLQENPPRRLDLPGSVHMDEAGGIVLDQPDLFASLPPPSSDQLDRDAGRHFAELARTFPKWQPHTMTIWTIDLDFCGCQLSMIGTNLVLH
jgi:hypothetical protein